MGGGVMEVVMAKTEVGAVLDVVASSLMLIDGSDQKIIFCDHHMGGR